jgi:hypothetical protein
MTSNSPKTFAERDSWIRAALAANLPDAAFRVAIAIAMHLHVKSGRCNPSYATLAAESHVPERSTYRLVDLLEQAGWIAIERGGGRRLSNQYVLLNPANMVAEFSGSKPCQSSDRVLDGKLCQIGQETLPNRPLNSANMVADKQRNSEEENSGKRESISPDLNLRHRKKKKDSVSKDLFGNTEAKTEPKAARKKKGNGSAATDVDDAFDRFWTAFPKHVGKLDARKAFAKALQQASADELIAGAQRYAVTERARIEREGTPQFTKHPASWLRAGKWMDELNGAPVIDEDGNLVAIEQPRQQQPARTGFAAIARAMIEESERGKLLGTHDEKGWPIYGRRQ